ncbi:ATP-binding protein [Tepidibacter mesophilus]|uniref:ATP-binding protein n=1 Tax=Tepidibacter mesophilus TaxID=655607 RepID=UPI001FA84E66|nr:ATP-binding protein [Tepidibacter mesophilus]
MKQNREDILKSNKEVGRLFTRAYKFLKAAESIVKDVVVKYKEAMDFGKVNSITLDLIDEILGNVEFKGKAGYERHLFGTAISPNGVVEYTDTIFNDATDVYYIKGDMGTGKSTLLGKVYKNAILKGLDVEVYHTPLIKDKIETIWIKDINIGLTVSSMFKEKNYKLVDLNNCINNDILDKYKEEIEYDNTLIEKLIKGGIDNIRRAKQEHDVMEKYYIPNMNFDKVEKLKCEIKDRILEFK